MKIIKGVPLGIAIFILIFLITIAVGEDPEGYIIDREKVWISIVINSCFIIVSMIRCIPIWKENYKVRKQLKHIRRGIIRKDPEILFDYAIARIRNTKSDIIIKESINIIGYCANQGYQPAIKFINSLKSEIIQNISR